MLAVEDPYVAWCLDNAVMLFGQALDAELESVEGKGKKQIQTKRQRVLNKWLDIPQAYKAPPGAVRKR